MKRLIDRLNIKIVTSLEFPFKKGSMCFDDYNYAYYNKVILHQLTEDNDKDYNTVLRPDVL